MQKRQENMSNIMVSQIINLVSDQLRNLLYERLTQESFFVK